MQTQRIKSKLWLAATASLTLFATACGSYNALGGGAVARPAGWNTLSHSKDASPDYATVFQDTEVKRLDLTIEASDWKLMQDNMTELFGAGGQGGPGGFGGPGGAGNAGGVPGERPIFPGTNPNGNFTLPAGFPADWQPGDPVPEGLALPQRPGGMNGEMPGEGGFGGGGALEMEVNPIYRPATLSFEGKAWQHVGVRFKGNSSLRSSWGRTLKLPLRFDFDEFEDTYPEIDDQRFFGFKRLTLSSGFSDDSLVREKVAADIFRAAGVPAPRTAFYRVYLDYGEGSQYMGLYTMVEVPDTPMFQTQFKQTGGNLYKPSGNGAKFGSFDAEAFPKKTNEEAADWGDIESVFSALHADRSDAARWRTGLEKVFDVDGFLKYLAVNTVIQNWDTYGRMAHNYYLYTDPSDQRVHWISWDHNMALSSSGFGGGNRNLQPQPTASASPTAMPATNPSASPGAQNPATGANPAAPNRPGSGGVGGGGPGGGAPSLALSEIGEDWPLIRYLLDDAVYLARYREQVQATVDGPFAVAATQARYQQAHSLIRPYVVGAEGEQEKSTLLSSPEAFEPALNQLIEHLNSRHQAVQAYLGS